MTRDFIRDGGTVHGRWVVGGKKNGEEEGRREGMRKTKVSAREFHNGAEGARAGKGMSTRSNMVD